LADNAGVDEHVNLSAGMVTANFRADAGSVKSAVKAQRVDTGRSKLGAVIGAGSFICVGAMLMPGVKIGEGCIIGPLTLVLEDVPDNTLYYSEQKYVKKQISREHLK
jgi:bifunctional UDP-N-acetylglucosamine pyrophosphorylase/glucosamine-1-phosphate N-acetyltransferase